MKKIILITLLFTCIYQLYGQSGWKVDVRVILEEYIQSTEINIEMQADIYHDGTLITPQPDYKFVWYRSLPIDENPVWEPRDTTYGYPLSGTHALQDSTQYPAGKMDFYCAVTIPGYNITINSDTIRVPWYSVLPDQKKSNGASFGSVSYWYKGNFRDNNGLDIVMVQVKMDFLKNIFVKLIYNTFCHKSRYASAPLRHFYGCLRYAEVPLAFSAQTNLSHSDQL